MRQAGWGAGVLVLVLDITKGCLPVYLARSLGGGGWILAFVAAAIVVGHCWPLFAGFRGGMGLAASGGAILALSPLGFFFSVGLLIVLVLVIHHSARASLLAGLLLPWALWAFGLRGDVFWVALAVGIVVAVRFLVDWNRQYRELWLDRPQR
jgi:glycerol-3-phosphate acyltransferase PlsY